MLTAARIHEILTAEKPFLATNWGVDSIGLFGSYARGEATADSDVDLLVTFSRPIGWEIVDLKDYLEERLGVAVDLVTPRALKPLMAPAIWAEVLPA
jgi:predicted nucleotidyltransferase